MILPHISLDFTFITLDITLSFILVRLFVKVMRLGFPSLVSEYTACNGFCFEFH